MLKIAPAHIVGPVPYCYIVECADGSYYVGSTWDLEGRIWEHNNSPDGAAYTRRRRPVTLAWAGEFDSIAEAYAFEKRVQGWSRAKRRALIEERWDDLPALSSRVRERRTAVTDPDPDEPT